MSASLRHYRGRFAPSPTGDLHFGSLVAALGSYLDARANCGEWIVRMEDVDVPRVVAGSADAILRTLENFGFEWDGPVVYQSRRTAIYKELTDQLEHLDSVYPCTCSRREVSTRGAQGIDGPVYPGTCRDGLPKQRKHHSLRLRTDDELVDFDDRIQGSLSQNLAKDIGDFVVRRADGLFAYQLAVVVDDALQDITHVVRGADLLVSTPRQILLQRRLELTTPEYAHLPLAVASDGRKLSKQHASAPVDPKNPVPALLRAFEFLGQRTPHESLGNLKEFWNFSFEYWNLGAVPRVTEHCIE